MDLQHAQPSGVETLDAEDVIPKARPTAREHWAEVFLDRIERTPIFDALARTLTGAFSKIVRPGPAKDVLSGTAMGHPAHPMLTDVTIGAWTSAVLLDLFGSAKTNDAADALIGVGVASVLPTAVTGLSDLSDVEARDVRTIGGAHALGNISAASLFAASWIMRKLGRRRAGIALSLAGSGVATVAGFLGGHLAYRRGIGVDTTAFDERITGWTAAIAEAELGERPKMILVGRNELMLYRDGPRIVALANRCSHRGGPLHKGTVGEGTVTCPWHRSTFRLEDGSILCGPAVAPQPTYEVRARDGMIEVRAR